MSGIIFSTEMESIKHNMLHFISWKGGVVSQKIGEFFAMVCIVRYFKYRLKKQYCNCTGGANITDFFRG